jgi:hypothetical protein
MPEENYNLNLDGDQIQIALGQVHGADDKPIATSLNMVRSGGLYTHLAGFRASSGYGVYADSEHTENDAQVVGDARSQLTIDGLGSSNYTGQLPSGVTDLWDTSSNYITPENVGDGYMIRIDFRYKCSSQSSYFDIELDISPAGDGSTVILLDTIQCLKSANTEARYSRTHMIYSLETFVTNKGRLFVNTTDAGPTVSVYNKTVVIGRFHKAI